MVPRSLDELLARYLAQKAAAIESGQSHESNDEVVLHDAVPVQSLDPRQAWDEATSALRYLAPDATTGKSPPGWANIVAGQDPAVGLAFAVGNFPQSVRDLNRLMNLAPPPAGAPAIDDAAFDNWVESLPKDATPSHLIIVFGLLRLARRYDAAERFRDRHGANIPAAWRNAWTNEEAALLWHSGRQAGAAALWATLPECAPVLFNRGMAALLLGQSADARPALLSAVEQIPESSGWHHLGRLYLALAR